MLKRKIEDNFIEKQKTLQPFEFKNGPIGEHYTDKQNIIWVTIKEFPAYEISKTKIVRRKVDKTLNNINNEGYVRFYLAKTNRPLRSLDSLYRKAFNEFEPFIKIENELWCELAEFPNYLVSNMGRVMNKQTLYLIEGTNVKGYLKVDLESCDGKDLKLFIHTLVTLAFIGPAPSTNHTPNHKNGIKDDNKLTNLEYATQSEQSQHAYQTGLHKDKKPKRVKVDNINNEKWLPVPVKFVGDNAQHDYQVSNFGRLRSNDYLLQRKPNAAGYTEVGFVYNKQEYSASLHIVVATAFIPNPNNLPEVDHIDPDKSKPTFNAVSNLQWITRRGNVEKACSKSVTRFNSTTQEKVIYTSAVRAAEANTGFKASSIRNVCNGRNKTYKGFEWWYNTATDENDIEIKADENNIEIEIDDN